MRAHRDTLPAAPAASVGTADSRPNAVLLLLLFHCHFFACLFYLVATEEGRYESNWFAVTQAAKPGHGSADTLARWLFAYYWAIVTFATIGYGDIVPVSNRECVHCWQCMACTYGGSLRRIQ